MDFINLNDEYARMSYENKVQYLIRLKYSLTDEFKIIRQMLATKDTTEFDEYNSYVDCCIAHARTSIVP